MSSSNRYTDEQVSFLRYCASMGVPRLAKAFNRTFQQNRSDYAIRKTLRRYGIKTGNRYFKAGNLPANTRRTGEETFIKNEGAVRVKTLDGTWKYRHRLLWESERGKIPSGMVLFALDGDLSSQDVGNFVLLTKSEAAALNRRRLYTYPREVREAVVASEKLKATARKLEQTS